MASISDLQKAINDLDAEIKEKETEIGTLRLYRERLENSEKERKKRASKKKADKEPQKTQE